jgi:DNA-binding SARP family transcriptional activator
VEREPVGSVRLIESLNVIIEGQAVNDLAPKERALLTRLAMDARKRVSHDQICQVLWGTNYSSELEASYRAVVSRLRKKCRDKNHTLIARESGGYRLGLDPGDVDILSFQAARRAGGAAADAGDWPRALGPLTLARKIWTGDPYFYTEFPYLREKYERQLSRDLGALLARHAEAVIRVMSAPASASVMPDLEALIRKDKSNEHLRWLYMTALYRSGSQGKATAYYVRTQRYLADRYGKGPSQALQNLYKLMNDANPCLLRTPLPV